MRTLKIDTEFRDKVPPLTDDEKQRLEENILADGKVLVPIVVWNDVIVDGHNRYEIVKRHPEIQFDVINMDFADRYEAIVWICKNQLGRRNLTDEQKTYLLGKQFEAQKKARGGQIGNKNNNNKKHKVECTKMEHSTSPQSGDTARNIAKENGVGRQTVRRAEMYAKGVDVGEDESPGFKEKILSRKITAPKVVISKLPSMPVEERREIIRQIENGEIRQAKVKRVKQTINTGRDDEARELYANIDSAVNNMYEATGDTEYTAQDLVEELKVNADAYVEQVERAIQIRSSVLNEDGARELISSVLEETVEKLKNIRRELL